VASITDNLDNPLILAIETSGRLGSVALACGDKRLAENRFSGPMRHSAEIFPAITDLLSKFNKKPDQIEQVYISVGPGSFTGLRIAVTLAKTLALANSTKIVAIDTLDCIAANVIKLACTPNAERCSLLLPNECLATILDAKRGQFFIAVYEQSAQNPVSFPRKRESIDDYPLYAIRYPLKKILPDCLMTAEEFLDRFAGCGKPIALIGEGLVYYKDKFSDPAVQFLDEKYWNPSATNIHRLGWQLALQNQFANPLTLTPNYIRGPDVTIKRI
jgi:tRNA threonylcarbamoyladenosine biosynthesis protein TsaB